MRHHEIIQYMMLYVYNVCMLNCSCFCLTLNGVICNKVFISYQGRIQDFKLRGAHLNFFGGISCENSRFYAKKADYRISLLPLTSNSENKTVVSKLHCMSNL